MSGTVEISTNGGGVLQLLVTLDQDRSDDFIARYKQLFAQGKGVADTSIGSSIIQDAIAILDAEGVKIRTTDDIIDDKVIELQAIKGARVSVPDLSK